MVLVFRELNGDSQVYNINIQYTKYPVIHNLFNFYLAHVIANFQAYSFDLVCAFGKSRECNCLYNHP